MCSRRLCIHVQYELHRALGIERLDAVVGVDGALTVVIPVVETAGAEALLAEAVVTAAVTWAVLPNATVVVFTKRDDVATLLRTTVERWSLGYGAVVACGWRARWQFCKRGGCVSSATVVALSVDLFVDVCVVLCDQRYPETWRWTPSTRLRQGTAACRCGRCWSGCRRRLSTLPSSSPGRWSRTACCPLWLRHYSTLNQYYFQEYYLQARGRCHRQCDNRVGGRWSRQLACWYENLAWLFLGWGVTCGFVSPHACNSHM